MTTVRNAISKIKIRFWVDFVAPNRCNNIEEITLYNKSKEDLSTIPLYFEKSVIDYNFYDLNDTPLEFFFGDPRENINTHGTIVHIIFPREKPFYAQSYRTIKIVYNITTTDTNLRVTSLHLNVPKKVDGYVCITQCRNYEFDVIFDIAYEDKDFTIEPFLQVRKEKHFFDLYTSSNCNNNRQMSFIVTPKIPEYTIMWYQFGLLLGGMLILLVPILYHYKPSNMSDYLTFASIILSLLIIIKGWMNQFEVTRQSSNYNKIFWTMVVIIILEIIYMVFHYILLLPQGISISTFLEVGYDVLLKIF